ncbi:MAG: spore coat protein CotH [Hamadaea sp.]|nr:spore coat protein CotH [Hamadaea sp.]
MAGATGPGAPGPPTRLKHRIPVRVRHYWKLLATCVLAVVALVVLAGNVQIRPIVTGRSASAGQEITENVTGTVDLFDAGAGHTVSVTFDDADYQRMLDNYMATGEKDYVRADLTIDGTLVRDVGLRLKGNSTLSMLTHEGKTRSLFGDREGGGFPGGQGGFPGGGQLPEGGMPGGGQGGFPGGGQLPEGGMPGGGQGGFPGGGRTSLDSSRPEELPWLVSFDEFVDGRRYQGLSQLALRVSGMGGGSTVLNEAVSLTLVQESGQAAQRYAYTGFTVNDRPAKVRLLVEHPDDGFAAQLGDGVLYKALATSSFTYQGEDPTAYEDDFKQINNKGSHDLQPVIDLLKWVNEASDADFAAHLDEHVDVESFAAYVALQNLLLNSDDMAGPGRNYYLWYDLDTATFRVLSWDHNLTFSGSADQGPHDATGMFGGRGMGGGFQLPEGMELPEGFTPPQGEQPGGAGGPRGGGIGGGNKLKERFLAADAFTAVYDKTYRELYQKLYASGAALKALDSATSAIAKAPGYDAASVKTDADRLRATIQQRTTSLAKDKVITG